MTHEQIQRALAAIVATLDEGRVLDATRDAKHLLTTLGAFTEPTIAGTGTGLVETPVKF